MASIREERIGSKKSASRCLFDKGGAGGVKSYLGDAHMEATHFKKRLPNEDHGIVNLQNADSRREAKEVLQHTGQTFFYQSDHIKLQRRTFEISVTIQLHRDPVLKV